MLLLGHLLPTGAAALWLAIGLSLLAIFVRLWMLASGAASIGGLNRVAGSGSWPTIVAQRLYAGSALLILLLQIGLLGVPFSATETLAPGVGLPSATEQQQPTPDHLRLNLGQWQLGAVACAHQPTTATTAQQPLCRPPWWLQRDLSRYQFQPTAAVTVLENGAGLWGQRSTPDAVADHGHGRFAIVETDAGPGIWFSATDGSDPLTNGSNYQLRYPVALHWLVQLTALLFCLPLLRVMLGTTVQQLAKTRLQQPDGNRHPGLILTAGFFGLTCLLLLQPLWEQWSSAGSRFAIAGVLPWSDASNWFNGALHFLHLGELESWTVRRPLNPLFLAALLQLAQLDWQWTLMLRALLLAASLMMLCRVLIQQFGVIPALAALGLAAAFAHDFVPVALTEVQGLIYAFAGFALLLQGATSLRLGTYALGAALVTVGLSMRLGPLGLLPAFVLWPIFHIRQQSRWRWVWVCTLSIIAALALTGFWTYLYYPGQNVPGANFAYTFYGLAFGGEPWTLFASHYPQLAQQTDAQITRVVWQQALAQVQSNPDMLLQGLQKFCGNYIRYFFIFVDAPLHRLAVALFVIGVVAMALQPKQRLCSFILLCYLGELVTVPLIYWSLDAYRAFAVSLPLSMTLLAGGTYALLQLPKRRWNAAEPLPHLSHNIHLSMGVVLLMLVSLAPVLALQHQTLLTSPHTGKVTQALGNLSCADDEQRLLLDLQHSSPGIYLPSDLTSDTWHSQVNYREFRLDPGFYKNPIAAQLLSLEPGDELIYGFNLNTKNTIAADYRHHGAASTAPPLQAWLILPRTLKPNAASQTTGLHLVCAVPTDSSAAATKFKLYRATNVFPLASLQ